jgi:ribosome-binding ATPase
VALDVGIVGPPGSGKTTLFTALTGVRPEGYGTPHVGVAPIADERLDAVASVVGSAKRTPATIRLIDVPGTAEAQLGGVRRSDALLAVIRDPSDLPSLELELLVADRDHVERRLERVRK